MRHGAAAPQGWARLTTFEGPLASGPALLPTRATRYGGGGADGAHDALPSLFTRPDLLAGHIDVGCRPDRGNGQRGRPIRTGRRECAWRHARREHRTFRG